MPNQSVLTKKYPSLSAVIHALLKNAPSGLNLQTIAGMLDKPYATLLSETSQQPGHKLGADLLLPIMEITGADQQIMNFLAHQLGGVYIQLQTPALNGGELASALADSAKEYSEFMHETAVSISDGNIPKDQLDRITKEGNEAMEAIATMIRMARVTHEAQYRVK